MKQLTIKTIKSRIMNTKFGEKEKMSVIFKEKPALWVDVWMANWCKGWNEGDVVEIKDEQWKSREYNGKTYWTIQAPPEAKFQGVGRNEFDALITRVEKLEADSLGEDVEDENEEEEGPEEEEISVKDIPFR